jgi:integral membrane sensor domain MASE1
MHQLLGIIVGTFAGIVWEKISTAPYQELNQLVPSLIFNHAGRTFHLHHWPVYFLLLLVIVFVAVKTNRIFHPAVLMLAFFFIYALAYNFYKFPDWHIFVQ